MLLGLRMWGLVLATLLSSGLGLHAARAADSPLAHVNLHAAILLRAMAYERGLSAEVTPLKVAVLHGDSPDDGMLDAFEQLAKSVKVANRVLETTSVALTGRTDALAALRELQPQVIYVPAHHAELLVQMGKTFTESHPIILCADPEDMANGCLLAVEQGEGKARVVIHLSLAQRMGLHFDGRLLQLARVVTD